MKTFTKHILLLALMLFGVAGAAWADRAPQKFTGPVDFTTLVQDDTLAPGFSLTGFSVSDNLYFDGGRFSFNGTPQADPTAAVLGNANSLSYPDGNIVLIFGESTFTLAPMVDMTTAGNAWVVTNAIHTTEGHEIHISGIYIAPDPTVPALDELTGNWNFLMPGSNKVVKAVLLDSIVVGPHVELYDAQPAFAAGDIYHRGDSTIYYYDTNNHHSFHLRADEQADGKYFGFWSDLDPTDDQYTDRANRYVSPGFLTCGHRYTAAYPDNHTLTLATPQGGGTLELASEGVETVYTITFEQSGSSGDSRNFTIPASRFPYDTTFSYNANVDFAYAYDQMGGSVDIFAQGANWITVRISGPFEYGGYYSCDLDGGGSDNWTISCTATGTQPKMPYGITKTGDNTYSVMEGLTVNVTATPDSAHYLSAIGNEAVISNSAYNISFTMPDDDAELAATFTTKPTLTLAQTAGGTLEAIVPQGGVTAMHLTTDQIPTWSGNTEYAMEADLQQFGFVAVDSAAAAAWTGAPASGYITLVYALAGNKFKVHVFQDGQWYAAITFDFYKADFYTSPDVFYFTTGASKSNVIASSTPNTYYIDYGTPVTVVATPDAQHYLVSFSDDDNDTNSNLAVEKTYDSVIADIIDLSATFQAKPVLTLTANDGGTLTLDGYTPGTESGTTTVTFGYGESSKDGITLTGFPWSSSVSNIAGTITSTIGNITSIVVNGYYCSFAGAGWSGNDEQRTWTGNATSVTAEGQAMALTSIVVTVTTEGTPAVYPDGVTATETENQYRVDYGTEVTVTATPDSIHYLATLGGVTMGSNTAKDTTFALTATTTLDANFAPKPTLTLAHNDGGEMEVIPAGGLTAIVPPTDQIALWEGNYAGNLAENDLPATLGFVAVNQAAAEAWTGAPASGNAMLIYDIDGEYFHYLSFNNGSLTGNDEGTSTPGGFYNMASAGTLYITTGVTPSNVTASTEPNTYIIDYGTTLTVEATPAVHYHLEGWSSNVTDNGDSTATLTLTQDETVSATFAQNAPELAWEYDNVILANGDTLSAYHGFEMDTIAKLIFSSNDEFFDAYMNALQNTGTSLLRFGSSNTNVVSFANPFDPQSLSVNAPGTATVYMVHDGSVMAYDSAYFTAMILAPDTLTLVHNDGGEMEVELEVWGDGVSDLILAHNYTADGITFTTSDETDVLSSGQWFFPGSVTFTSADDNFSRIKMTLTSNYDYTNWNNAEGWTVDATSAVWEGNANEVVIPSCTTQVSQITFVRGSVDANSADSIRAIVADTTYAVVPGANVTVKAMPDSAHYLVNWDNDAAIYSNTDTTKHYVVNGNVTATATFNAKPVLTLAASDTSWGKVTLGGYSPVGLSTEQLSVPSNWNDDWDIVLATEMPTDFQTVDGNVARTWQNTTGKNVYLIFDEDEGQVVSYYVYADGTYDEIIGNPVKDGLVRHVNDGGLVLYTTGVIPGGMPAGVAQIDSVTYRVDYGTEVTVQADATKLHHVANWVNEDSVAYPADSITYGAYFVTDPVALFPDSSTLTLTVTADTTAKAIFGINSYDVTAMAQLDSRDVIGTGVAMGTVQATYRDIQGDAQSVAADDTITYTAQGATISTLVATPVYGYLFSQWTDTTGKKVFGTTDTLRLDSANVVVARFVPDTFAVATDLNVERMGTVTGAGRYPYLTQVTLEGVSEYGYHFARWNDFDTNNPRTVQLVQDTAFKAFFDYDQFRVQTSSANDTMGSAIANLGTDFYCNYLYTTTFVATPATGYHFVQWSNGLTTDTARIVIVQDTVMVAFFAPNKYTVTAKSASATMGTTSGSDVYDYGTTATLVATAKTGYSFTRWSDGVTTAERTITIDFTHDTTVTANFTVNQYTVTVESADTVMGSVSGTATVDYNTRTSISATANEHYHFVKWNDGVTSATRTVTVREDVTYTATFAPDMYTITGLADQGQGSVTGSGSYAYLTNATLTATPACGYLFDHWSNLSTESSITVQVTGNETYTAFFRPSAVEVVHDTIELHDTTVVEIHDTTVVAVDTMYIPVPDTTLVPVVINDTTIVPVDIFDTTVVPVTWYDTTRVDVTWYDTTIVDVTINDTTVVPVTWYDTTHVDVTVMDTTIVPVTIVDTTLVPVVVPDTTLVPVVVPDTTFVPVTVYDTTVVPVTDYDTTVVPVTWYDTTVVPVTWYDTTVVPVTWYDTTRVDVTEYDTTHVDVTVVDSTLVPIHDTVIEYVEVHDTLWLVEYIYDTVYIHDTIFVGIDDVDALDAKIYANNGQIVVEGADGNKVVLYDVTGRILATKVDEYAPLRFDIPVSGTYLVKIGNHAARRIVMIR